MYTKCFAFTYMTYMNKVTNSTYEYVTNSACMYMCTKYFAISKWHMWIRHELYIRIRHGLHQIYVHVHQMLCSLQMTYINKSRTLHTNMSRTPYICSECSAVTYMTQMNESQTRHTNASRTPHVCTCASNTLQSPTRTKSRTRHTNASRTPHLCTCASNTLQSPTWKSRCTYLGWVMANIWMNYD